jgi:hypothetical protein
MAFKAVILGLVVLAIHGQFIAQARPAGEEAKAEAPVEKAAGAVAEKAADAGELEAKNPAKGEWHSLLETLLITLISHKKIAIFFYYSFKIQSSIHTIVNI